MDQAVVGQLILFLLAAGLVTFVIGTMILQDSVMAAGWLLLLAGSGLIAVSFGFDTSVEGPRLYSGLPSETRVQNLGLMQTQLILAIGGATAFMAGIVLMVAAKALEALAALKSTNAPIENDEGTPREEDSVL